MSEVKDIINLNKSPFKKRKSRAKSLIPCEFCENFAFQFCEDCVEFLCKDCTSSRHSNDNTKNHSVIRTMGTEDFPTVTTSPTTTTTTTTSTSTTTPPRPPFQERKNTANLLAPVISSSEKENTGEENYKNQLDLMEEVHNDDGILEEFKTEIVSSFSTTTTTIMTSEASASALVAQDTNTSNIPTNTGSSMIVNNTPGLPYSDSTATSNRNSSSKLKTVDKIGETKECDSSVETEIESSGRIKVKPSSTQQEAVAGVVIVPIETAAAEVVVEESSGVTEMKKGHADTLLIESESNILSRRPSRMNLSVDDTFKVLVVGNSSCGKSSIIKRLVTNEFSDEYASTIGAEFQRKVVSFDDGSRARLQIWDIAGQDRFAKLTRCFFKRAKGAAIVCDVTRSTTFEAVKVWKNELDEFAATEGVDIPVILLANKCDLLVDVTESFKIGGAMEKLKQELGITEWFSTSAKAGSNVTEAFERLAKDMKAKILSDAKEEDTSVIKLTSVKKKSKCCTK